MALAFRAAMVFLIATAPGLCQVDVFAKAFERNPQSIEAAYNLALALLQEQRPVEALAILDKSSGDELLALRGAVLNALGRSEEAAGALRKAVAAGRSNPDTLYDFALTLLKTDAVPEAADVLARGRRRFPRSAGIHAASGMTAYRMGKYEESIRMYELAVQLEPSAADFHASLGDVLDATAALSKANAAYAHAVRLDASVPVYQVKYGRNLLKLRRPAEARAAFERALKRDANETGALFELGKLAAAAQDFPGAIGRFEKAVAVNPAFKEAWYQLSLSYARLGKHEQSRAAMEHFRNLP